MNAHATPPTTPAGQSSPLAGVRVLVVAVNVPGPLCGLRLAEWGASVHKIEPPTGDPLHGYSPSWYEEMNRPFTVHRVDLKSDEGNAHLHELLHQSDILITSYRPSSLARMGLARADVHDRYPRLAQVAIVGHAGDAANTVGHDLTYQAHAGLVSPPALPKTLLADLAGAERAASAALALIAGQARGAGAGYAEVALEVAVDDLMAPSRHGATRDGAVLGGGNPLYGLYPSSDGWIAVAALERQFVEGLLRALELPLELVSAPAAAMSAALRERLAARTSDQWEEWARQRDLPLARVR